MAYTISTPRVVPQAIAATDTVQNLPLGTVVTAVDPTLGEGEFIYLKGVASTAVGSVVIYDTKAATSTLATAGSRGPVAVAMSANVASQYGWYQISGTAVVAVAAAVAAGAPAFATATAGSVDDAVVTGDKVDGMVFKVLAGAAGTTAAQLDRPNMNGNG